jgi:hypothetical protein
VLTEKTPKMLLVVVALHLIKCAVILLYSEEVLTLWTGKRSNDIVMYISIFLFLYLSVYIYIYTSVSLLYVCLSFSLCEKHLVFLSRPHLAEWQDPLRCCW